MSIGCIKHLVKLQNKNILKIPHKKRRRNEVKVSKFVVSAKVPINISF